MSPALRISIPLLAVAALCAAQGPAVEGTWTGALEVPGGMKLRLAIHIAKAADGKLSGTMDSLDQGAMGMPLSSVAVAGKSFELTLNMVGGVYKGTLNEAGNQVSGTWQQGGGPEMPLSFTKSDKPPEPPKRPQMPAKPYPYDEEDVFVGNAKASLTLGCTLTKPREGGPFPAVVLITGSGAQDRDEALMGHRPFLVLADHLTRQGFAVLRCDDRGFAKSTGSFATATSEDFATDVAAQVTWLKERKDIDPKRIALCGHSEGAIIAPMVANRTGGVFALVLMAATAVPGDQVLRRQGEAMAKAAGAPQAAIDQQLGMQEQMFKVMKEEPDLAAVARRLREVLAALGSEQVIEAQIKRIANPWFRYFLSYDPAAEFAKVKLPVLALNGELDLQVLPDQNLPPLEAALKKAGNTNYKIQRFPGLNHLFQTAKVGTLAEYSQIEETIAPVALNAISGWLRQQARLEAR
jgi:pimeloyl-ACP methyl ester carboxylesterase